MLRAHNRHRGQHLPISRFFLATFSQDASKLSNRRGLKKLMIGKLNMKERTNLRNHLRRQQGVSAKFKKICVHADLSNAKQTRPDTGQELLFRGPRSPIRFIALEVWRCPELEL